MQRKKPLRRKKRLSPGGPLRRSRVERQKIRTRGWRKGVYKATDFEWTLLRAAKMGPCRVCGATTDISLHHLLGGNRRSDVEDNLIPLCGDGTRKCHGIYTTRGAAVCGDGRKRTWGQVAHAIRASLLPSETGYVVDRVGWDGLERRYPLLGAQTR